MITCSVALGVGAALAAAAALAGGALLVLVVLGPRVRGRLSLPVALPFLGVGVIFGLSYVALFEAYYRGRVTVVSPLVATESLWGVALSLLLIRHTELVGRRVLVGALLTRLVVPLIVLTAAATRPDPPVLVQLPLGPLTLFVAATVAVPTPEKPASPR